MTPRKASSFPKKLAKPKNRQNKNPDLFQRQIHTHAWNQVLTIDHIFIDLWNKYVLIFLFVAFSWLCSRQYNYVFVLELSVVITKHELEVWSGMLCSVMLFCSLYVLLSALWVEQNIFCALLCSFMSNMRYNFIQLYGPLGLGGGGGGGFGPCGSGVNTHLCWPTRASQSSWCQSYWETRGESLAAYQH